MEWVLGLTAQVAKVQMDMKGTPSPFLTCSTPITLGRFLWSRTKAKIREMAFERKVNIADVLIKAVKGQPVVLSSLIV